MTDEMFNFVGFYARMAARREFLRYVEVGVHEGHSLRYLSTLLKLRGTGARAIGVDLWNGSAGGKPVDDSTLATCIQNLTAAGLSWQPYPEAVTTADVYLLRADSLKAALLFKDNSLDFVFLDSDHSYEHVRSEIPVWLDKMRSGGILAGHDYGEPCGVKQAVDEAFPNATIEGTVWSIQVP